MSELKPRIRNETSGIDYVLAGDNYIPVIELPGDDRPIDKWGWMHTYLADLNAQAQDRCRRIVKQILGFYSFARLGNKSSNRVSNASRTSYR